MLLLIQAAVYKPCTRPQRQTVSVSDTLLATKVTRPSVVLVTVDGSVMFRKSSDEEAPAAAVLGLVDSACPRMVRNRRDIK